MPKHKQMFHKGRLFIDFEVEYPASGSLAKEQLDILAKILPGPLIARAPPSGITEMEDVDLVDAPNTEKGGGNDNENEKQEREAYESDGEDGDQRGVPGCAQQ